MTILTELLPTPILGCEGLTGRMAMSRNFPQDCRDDSRAEGYRAQGLV